MNIEEYISTGILESYVIGDLSERERAELEKNLLLYPELKEELNRVELLQEELLMKVGVVPNPQLKNNLLNSLSDKNVKVVALSAHINYWKYFTAASVLLAITSMFLAYNFWIKWRNAETNLNDLIAQNERIAQDYNHVNQRLDKIVTDLNIINNPDFKRVVMKGTEDSPEAMAYVYWNQSTEEVYLSIQNLKELSQENQYQLWAIIDGKPVDAGVFDKSIAGLLKMKDMPIGAAAFAVTIEPRGGKSSPTLETMQVVGNVIKG